MLNHRTNRGGGQNLKGRSSGHSNSGGGGWASASRRGTCTNGHCGTPPKTITLETGVVAFVRLYGSLVASCAPAWRVEPPVEPRPATSLRTSPGYDEYRFFAVLTAPA